MKADDIFDAIGETDDKMVEDAKKPKKKKKSSKNKLFVSLIAALLAVSVLLGIMLIPSREEPGDDNNRKEENELLDLYAFVRAEYPEMAQFPDSFYEENQYDNWREDRMNQQKAYNSMEIDLDEYLRKSVSEFLSDTQDENKVFSPLNVYMALAMLAEITDGNSRSQILNLFGLSNIEELRLQANAVWNAHYCDDGTVTSVLANSVWLRDGMNYNNSTLETLAKEYYASSFKGVMGSDDYNKALCEWLNEQTGNMLSDQIEDIGLDPDTIIALASTVYFRAKWSHEFSEEDTEEAVFHSPDEDITCDFMNQSSDKYYLDGEGFSAVEQAFGEGGGMWFILPDEDVSIDELLKNGEALDLISGGYDENYQHLKVNLSVPKFSVSSQTDLTEGLKNLGITDVFDPSASDFSALSDGISDASISTALHGARVDIDEEGCTAAAYTILAAAGGAPSYEEIDFVVDRPFIFVITSEVGLPMFVGVVNNPI